MSPLEQDTATEPTLTRDPPPEQDPWSSLVRAGADDAPGGDAAGAPSVARTPTAAPPAESGPADHDDDDDDDPADHDDDVVDHDHDDLADHDAVAVAHHTDGVADHDDGVADQTDDVADRTDGVADHDDDDDDDSAGNAADGAALAMLDGAIEPTRGGAFTIPLLCAGVATIACCLLIPQADANRRMAYERGKLQADLEAVQRQVASNDAFLGKVSDDPNLAERLAQRQMKIIRAGTKVLELNGGGAAEMSPFHLTAVAPPPPMPPYRPRGGTLASLCYNPKSRLYLLGLGLLLTAVGLVHSEHRHAAGDVQVRPSHSGRPRGPSWGHRNDPAGG